MKKVILLLILPLLFYTNVCRAQSKWCRIFRSSDIDTSSKCTNFGFWRFDNWYSYLVNKDRIDTVAIGNILGYYSGKRNTNNHKIKVKHLVTGSKFTVNKKVILGGVSNLVSYFECESIRFGAIPNLRLKDTLDLGNARVVFLRSFQLPVIKRMHVIRMNRLDTILTNSKTDSFILFHGRRVYLKTDFRSRGPNE